jgi:hypothetical protein
MAEEPEEDEYDEEDEEEEEVMFHDNALRGFRFFWNNLNDEEHDEDDVAIEEEIDEWVDTDSENEEESNIPSSTFVAQKLQQQGVSYEELVKIILLQHDEYSDNEDFERIDGQTYGKIRIIVSNYTPEQASEPVPQPVPQPVSQPVVAPVVAEPKIYSRRIMCHV